MRMKRFLLLLGMVVVSLLTGCGSKLQLPDNPKEYEQRENSDVGYAYLVHEDKVFVPYCAYEEKYLGSCIGYYDIPTTEYTDGGRVYVCELKGYSSDEWIIDFLDMNCSEGMIWREVNTVDIPEGLNSEYEWNKLIRE